MKNKAILKLREVLELSQKDLGDIISISAMRVHLYEHGLRPLRAELAWDMTDLAKANNIELEFQDFFARKEKKPKKKCSLDKNKQAIVKLKIAEQELKIRQAIIEEQRKIIQKISKKNK